MIENYSFGTIKIDGQIYDHDVLVMPGQVKSWWRIEGHHVAKEDLEEALETEPEVIVFGTGDSGVMKVSEEIKDYLADQNIDVVIKVTGQAKDEYNRLKNEGKKIVGLFHLTC